MITLDLSNRYVIDSDGRLHRMTWADYALEICCRACCAVGLGYFISMVII